jgi:hypothetical protein
MIQELGLTVTKKGGFIYQIYEKFQLGTATNLQLELVCIYVENCTEI